MTVKPIHLANNPRLVLIFAGWGMDEHMFLQLRRGGYDIAVAFEYDTEEKLPEWIDDYNELCVIAWSYGVSMAERALQRKHTDKLTLKVAVNGTPTPVDDTTGIPTSIFQGTLQGLSERNIYKFYRRMCADSNQFAQWKPYMPQRTLESLTKELTIFSNLQPVPSIGWDIAYIAKNDAIIPPDNQRNAWQNNAVLVRETDSNHLPDFQSLLNELLVDKTDVEKKFSACAHTYPTNADAQRQMCEHVNNLLLQNAKATPSLMVEIGAGTGMLTRLYSGWLQPDKLQLWDLCNIAPSLPGEHRKCDAETEIKTLDNVDIIVSSATIQWMNNPKLFVTRCANALSPGGIAVISTFGPDTFQEINHLTPAPLHYIPSAEWMSMPLPGGCRLKLHEERTLLNFESSRQLLRHISLTGVNGCGISATTSQRACRAILASNISHLTYHSIYLTINKDA